MTAEVNPAWIMTKTPDELREHYRRQQATVYPVTLSYDEYCALIAAYAILNDITLGIRYTKPSHLKRIREEVVDVLSVIERRCAASAVPPDDDVAE